jgi:hypothetical protein
MNKNMLMLGLGFVTIWDTATTVYGTFTILGSGVIQVILSVLFGILITSFLFRTIPIIKDPSDDLIPTGAKILWFFAVLYDLFTAYMGNFDLILNQSASGVQKVIIAIGITIFICSAPIGLSSLWFEEYQDSLTALDSQ